MPGLQEWLLIAIIFGVLATTTVLPFWFIFKKAGFNPALSILSVIPFVNIAVMFYLAFAPWPALNRSNRSIENAPQ